MLLCMYSLFFFYALYLPINYSFLYQLLLTSFSLLWLWSLTALLFLQVLLFLISNCFWFSPQKLNISFEGCEQPFLISSFLLWKPIMVIKKPHTPCHSYAIFDSECFFEMLLLTVNHGPLLTVTLWCLPDFHPMYT